MRSLLAPLARAHAAMQDGWNVLHLIIALVPLGFGAMCALPPPTFPTSPGYAVLARIMPEDDWIIVSILLGLLGLLTLVTRDRALRAMVAALLATWHGTVAIGIWAANPVATGVSTYGVLALGAYSLLWRTVDAR